MKFCRGGRSMVVVSGISPGLIEDTLRQIRSKEQEEYTTKFNTFLTKNAQEPYTMTFVTFGLNADDLEPFFRSPFRFTYLKKTLTWLEATRWHCESPRQRFLFKAIKLLLRIAADPMADVDDELKDANIDDEAMGCGPLSNRPCGRK